MVTGVRINMLLLAFNLLPIPPLDGSQVLKHFLPRAWAVHYQRVGFYGIAILVMILYFAPGLLTAWLHPANVVSTTLLNVVRPSVLPSAGRWMSNSRPASGFTQAQGLRRSFAAGAMG